MDEKVDNHECLQALLWQAHVYGDGLPEDTRQAMEGRGLKTHVFPWTVSAGECGLKRNALYLIRPDGYIGFVDIEADSVNTVGYLESFELQA